MGGRVVRLAGAQRVLRDLESKAPALTEPHVATLLHDHHSFLDYELRSRLDRYHRELIEPLIERGPADESVAGELTARATGVLYRPPFRPPFSEQRHLEAGCTTTRYHRPTYDFTAPDPAQVQPPLFARGTTEGTLEAVATVGDFVPLQVMTRFSGEPSGTLAAFNKARATVGKTLFVPESADHTLIEVSVEVALEQTMGRQPPGWENFLFLLPLQILGEEAVLNGLAVGWCDVVLGLHTANGSTATFANMASADVRTTDDSVHVDEREAVALDLTAVLAPGTTAVVVTVDAQVISWVVRTESGHSAFCEFGVHQRVPGESLTAYGAALADGVLRVNSLQLRSCPVDVLSAADREPDIAPE
jgi:hypothetical protein